MPPGTPPHRGAAPLTRHDLSIALLIVLVLAWLMSVILVVPAHGAPAPDPDRTVSTLRASAPSGEDALRMPAPLAAQGTAATYDQCGGDDQIVTTGTYLSSDNRQPIAIASNGAIYTAVWTEDGTRSFVQVYRSIDGGHAWTLWGTRGGAVGVYADHPALRVAEGDQDRVYLAYRVAGGGLGNSQIRVAWSPLSAPTALWTEAIALSQTGVDFTDPSLDTDAISYATYDLYLAATGTDADGADVWFTRSVSFGGGWEPGYKIASMTVSTRGYTFPEVKYGWGGIVHCVWQFSTSDGSADRAVRYRRAVNRAAGALADWQTTVYLTSNADGQDEWLPSVAASYANMFTVVTWLVTRNNVIIGTGTWGSADAGATFPTAYQDSIPGVYDFGVKALPGVEGFIGGGLVGYEVPGVMHTANNTPWAWSGLQTFADRLESDAVAHSLSRSFDYDPTHGDRVAMVWPRSPGGVAGDTLFFDAEWRRDPGWPNYEDGMPMPLAAGAISAPALCELDGDPQSEIVFTDGAGNVQALNHDGSVVPGWPKTIASPLPYGDVAVGDLDGDGRNEVVVGNAAGMLYAWRHDGTPLAGWPVSTGTGAATYVSIGRLLPGAQEQVVVTTGTHLEMRRFDGTLAPGWPSYKDAVHQGPAAIGDVDGDGANEIVTVFGAYMNVQSATGTMRWWRNLLAESKTFVHSPTLADLDLDGNLEIAAPTAQGDVYVMHHDGTLMTGWPWSDGTAHALSAVSMANIWASREPELAFAVEDASTPHVHLLDHGGASIGTWPNATGAGWFATGQPVFDAIVGPPYYWMVIEGSRDASGYAWMNGGGPVPGWPKGIVGRSTVGAASGDIDADGRLEVVFTTETPAELVVVDMGSTAFRSSLMSTSWWPMTGYNPERQACLACGLDAVTGVPTGDPDLPLYTRLDPPKPNPTSGPLLLRYALPQRAAVRLEVYDVQGRLVRTLVRREVEAGVHDATWDGRDAAGLSTSAGVFYARLWTTGPAGEQSLVRRVVRLP